MSSKKAIRVLGAALTETLKEAEGWLNEARGCKPNEVIGYNGWADRARDAIKNAAILAGGFETNLTWTEMMESHPPLDEHVLVFCAGKGWPDIGTDRLSEGDNGLLYWDSGNDFDEVTHWAKVPAIIQEMAGDETE